MVDGTYVLMDELVECSGLSEQTLVEVFTPAAILENAHRIYDFISENGGVPDSVVREALFTFASDALDMDYDQFYMKWLLNY